MAIHKHIGRVTRMIDQDRRARPAYRYIRIPAADNGDIRACAPNKRAPRVNAGRVSAVRPVKRHVC